MKQIINRRPGILVLSKSKLTLKPKETAELEELSDEIQRAISKGWIELIDVDTQAPKAPAHDWEIDYSRVDEGVVTVSDKVTGGQVEGEIIELKGEEYFTLRDIGTVKKQQFWPTAQALERFDDAG